MAVKTAQYIFNGQAYNLTYNSTSGKWEATVTAPSKSSYNQPDHVLGGTVKATDAAGNTTTVDQSHATLGASLKLRVKRKDSTDYHDHVSVCRSLYHKYNSDYRIPGKRYRLRSKCRNNRNHS
jgi:hypothetical protein